MYIRLSQADERRIQLLTSSGRAKGSVHSPNHDLFMSDDDSRQRRPTAEARVTGRGLRRSHARAVRQSRAVPARLGSHHGRLGDVRAPSDRPMARFHGGSETGGDPTSNGTSPWSLKSLRTLNLSITDRITPIFKSKVKYI